MSVERDRGELWTKTRPESVKKILREGSEVLLSYLNWTEQCKGCGYGHSPGWTITGITKYRKLAGTFEYLIPDVIVFLHYKTEYKQLLVLVVVTLPLVIIIITLYCVTIGVTILVTSYC
jgi:hypothetical protein